MWLAGQLKSPVGIELQSTELDAYGVEGFLNDVGDQVDQSGRPIIDSLSMKLSDQCKEALNSGIPPTWTSSNFWN